VLDPHQLGGRYDLGARRQAVGHEERGLVAVRVLGCSPATLPRSCSGAPIRLTRGRRVGYARHLICCGLSVDAASVAPFITGVA
jgi:hypothetical protein